MQNSMAAQDALWFDDSASSSESSCEEFAIVHSYNEKMRCIYADRLKEKVLEALAFNASVS